MNGYIKLARCLIEKPIFQNEKLLKVWIWCLMKASHKEHTQLVGLQKVTLKTGQFITGRNAGAQQLKMKPSTFWDYMLWLKENQSLDIKSDNKKSLITLINWEQYQVDINKTDSETDSKPTAKQPLSDTNKNGKNDKNNNIPDLVKNYSSNNDLMDALVAFLDVRKKAKAQNTDRAIKLLLNELDKLASDDETKIAIVNQSIMGGWKSVYALKHPQAVKTTTSGGEDEWFR